MGSVSNSLASTPVTDTSSSGSSSSSTSSTSNNNPTGIFTGTSAYSQDFQNVIDRAVAIASLPINLLTAQQTTLSNQSTELTTLDTKFTALQTAVQGISDAMGGSSFQATSSSPTVVSATLGDGAVEGDYSLSNINIGAYASSLSSSTWNSTSTKATTYNLVVGQNVFSVTASDGSAATAAAAINAQYSNLVHAAVVNVGSATGGTDNRISLESTTLGPLNLDLQTVPTVGLQTQGVANNGFATSQTTATWDATPNPAGATAYTLVVGSEEYSFTASDNSAATVAAAINTQLGTLVQANVVDVGTGGNSDLRIALQSQTAGAMKLDIQKPTSYQQQTTTGALAQYQVTGSGVTATSASRSIAVANGVTLNLLANSASAVDVTVTQSTSALNTALSSFADAYNAAVDEVAGQHGQSAGVLQGQAILNSLQQALSTISTYNSSTGDINGLASLGLTLGSATDPTDGHLTYNALTLLAAGFSDSSGINAFLGSAPDPDTGSPGSGFLQAATNALTNLEDPTAGLLKTTEAATTSQITNIGNQISAKQTQVDNLQTQLTNQMAAADAAIATMEQQYSYLSSMFAAQQTADQQYANGG